MSRHTFLLDLPEILTGMGFNVVVADGWELGQCSGSDHYTFTDPATDIGSHDEKPFAYMVHHSGSKAATPPPAKTSKAGAWIGLSRGDRLYQYGGGIPTIYLASAGPARVSSGDGYRPAAWDNTFEQRRAPAHAQGLDSTPHIALNRYSFNVETVCEGVGSELDPEVWDNVVGLGEALERMTGLKEMTIGHTSWTSRKPDPEWRVGMLNDGKNAIVDVQAAVAAVNGADPTDCIPEWALQYWQPYVDTVWPGGAPDPCSNITHWQMANILSKLGLVP